MAPQVVPIYPPPPPPSKEDDDWMNRTFNGKKPYDTATTTTTVYNSEPSATITPFAEGASTTAVVAVSFTSKHSGPPPGSWTPREGEHHAISSAVMGAAGAIATLAFLCFTGGLLFCLCRRTRRRRRADSHPPPSRQEMIKADETQDTRAYIRTPTATTPSPTVSSPSAASLPPPPPPQQQQQHEEPPMLLSTTIDQSYYTGIDTSDMVSVTDNQRNSANDGGYAPSISEPPPPYRPRSIPPFSRDSSVRIPSGRPPSYGPRLSVRSQREVIRSPFDDPDEESPVSEINDIPHLPTGSREMEEMSDVSELSYQEEPVVARSSLN